MFQVVDDERFPENSYASHVSVLMSGTFFMHFKRLPDFFFRTSHTYNEAFCFKSFIEKILESRRTGQIQEFSTLESTHEKRLQCGQN